MKCIDEDFSVFGDFNTNIANNLMVVFDRCDPKKRTDCVSDDEFKEWLSFKYIAVFENEERYIQTKPRDERLQRYSAFHWYALSETRVDKVRMMTFNDI